MNSEVLDYIAGYGDEVQALFMELRRLVCLSAPGEVSERLWARLPSYYCGERFVRLIPFKDHINVEASAIPACAEAFVGCKLTPKGMLQLYTNQGVPCEALREAFARTLTE